MPAKNSDGLVDDRHRREPRLELLGRVLDEPRPRPRAGDEFLERRHHLAAVAHAQRERVRPREERRELVAGAGVVENRLRPALAAAEHVAVREPAARREPAEGRRATPGPR